MGNNFLESSLSSAVSMDLSSSWAARSWENTYLQQNSPQLRVKYYIKFRTFFLQKEILQMYLKILSQNVWIFYHTNTDYRIT